LKENSKLTDLNGFCSENFKTENIIRNSLQYTWTLQSRTNTQQYEVCGLMLSEEEV